MTDVLPEIQAKVEPFVEFGMAIAGNANKSPYIIYYIDEIFQDMNENQFNCADIVKASRVESQAIAALFEVASINQSLQTVCQMGNDEVLDALQSEEVSDSMESMRDYVEEMSSPKGH